MAASPCSGARGVAAGTISLAFDATNSDAWHLDRVTDVSVAPI